MLSEHGSHSFGFWLFFVQYCTRFLIFFARLLHVFCSFLLVSFSFLLVSARFWTFFCYIKRGQRVYCSFAFKFCVYFCLRPTALLLLWRFLFYTSWKNFLKRKNQMRTSTPSGESYTSSSPWFVDWCQSSFSMFKRQKIPQNEAERRQLPKHYF